MATTKKTTKTVTKKATKKTVSKKSSAVVSTNTLPGIEADATKTVLDMISSFLTAKHLSHVYDELQTKLNEAKGSARNNYRKISQYINSQNVLKQLVIPVTVKKGNKVTTTLPVQVEVSETKEMKPTRTKAAAKPKQTTFTVVDGKVNKNTAPGTKYSLATSDTYVPVVAPKADTNLFSDLLSKLMETELKNVSDQSVYQLKNGYVKAVTLTKNGEQLKVLVIGTALGYYNDIYTDVNCRVAEKYIAADMMLEQPNGKPYSTSGHKFVNKPNKEWRFVRLLDYDKFLNKTVRYWAQDKEAQKDINSCSYTLRPGSIEVSATPKKTSRTRS